MNYYFITVIIVIAIIILFALGLFGYCQKKVNKVIQKLTKTVSESDSIVTEIVDKAKNISYLADLKDAEIPNIDNNISTIDLEKKLTNTCKIHLLSYVCKELNLEIILMNIKTENSFVCVKGASIGTIIINENKITLSDQTFEGLVNLRQKVIDVVNRKE